MSENLRVPCWCPQCKLPLKGSKSTSSFYDWGVCVGCYIQFIDGREERWKTGWRPSSEQVQQFLESVDQ